MWEQNGFINIDTHVVYFEEKGNPYIYLCKYMKYTKGKKKKKNSKKKRRKSALSENFTDL